MIQPNNKIKKWKMARIRQNHIKREAERNILTQTAYGSSRNRIERNSYLLLDDVVPPHSSRSLLVLNDQDPVRTND